MTFGSCAPAGPASGRVFFDEQEHEPAEGQGAGDHHQEEDDAVADAVLLLRAADERHDERHEEGVDNHGEEVAFEDHGLFPTPMS
jgi:hypothetical protein